MFRVFSEEKCPFRQRTCSSPRRMSFNCDLNLRECFVNLREECIILPQSFVVFLFCGCILVLEDSSKPSAEFRESVLDSVPCSFDGVAKFFRNLCHFALGDVSLLVGNIVLAVKMGIKGLLRLGFVKESRSDELRPRPLEQVDFGCFAPHP